MSRSKQLAGFPTSGVFGFGQTHAHALRPPKPDYQRPRGRPARIGVFSRGIGRDEAFQFLSHESLIRPTDHNASI